MPVRYASRIARRAPPDEAAGPGPGGPSPTAEGRPAPPSRSHAAAFVAMALVLVGVLLGHWSILVPGFLAFLLLSSGLAFLSTRLNPLSVGFYLTTKPSWSAIGVLFLSGLLLLGVAYSYWRSGWGPVLPGQFLP